MARSGVWEVVSIVRSVYDHRRLWKRWYHGWQWQIEAICCYFLLQMFGQITIENDELGDPWAQINSRNNFQSFPEAIQVLFRYVQYIVTRGSPESVAWRPKWRLRTFRNNANVNSMFSLPLKFIGKIVTFLRYSPYSVVRVVGKIATFLALLTL